MEVELIGVTPPSRTEPQSSKPQSSKPPPSKSKVLSRGLLEDSFFDNDEDILRERQARAELLDQAAKFSGLERAPEVDCTQVVGMDHLSTSRRASVNLALPWSKNVEKIASLNHNIVKGKVNKSNSKPLDVPKPWPLRALFSGTGYPTHVMESYHPKPESNISSGPVRVETSEEDQPYVFLPEANRGDSSRPDLSLGEIGLRSSELIDLEGLARRTAGAINSGAIVTEFLNSQPEHSELSRALLTQLRLDVAASSQLVWRMVHNIVTLRRTLALVNLNQACPPIEPEQRVQLLRAPFTGELLFGGELAKSHKTKMEKAQKIAMFPNQVEQFSSKPKSKNRYKSTYKSQFDYRGGDDYSQQGPARGSGYKRKRSNQGYNSSAKKRRGGYSKSNTPSSYNQSQPRSGSGSVSGSSRGGKRATSAQSKPISTSADANLGSHQGK